MKLFLARALAFASLAALLAATLSKAQSSQAQTPSNPSPASPSGQDQSAPQPDPAAKSSSSARSMPTATTVSTTGAAAKPGAQTAATPSVEDADRHAITVTGLDLDVRLNTAAQQFAARAIVTVRNTGTAPLSRIPLQISSSLNWERIRIAGRDASFPVATINSDSDHTGQLHEAVIPSA